jgi:hypothetical protein
MELGNLGGSMRLYDLAVPVEIRDFLLGCQIGQYIVVPSCLWENIIFLI